MIKIRYKPLPKQRLFHESKCRFRGYVGGIGSGKTKAGSAEMIRLGLKYPGTTYIITAPTYPMLRDATQITFFELLPRELMKDWNKSEGILTLINGTKYLFRTGDNPDRLRGPNLDGFWMDEASEQSHMVWKILIGRIRRGVVDIGVATGTPKGFNWFYSEFVEKRRDEYFLVTSSSRENPYLGDEFIKSLEDAYSGTFAQQEIEGLFVGFEGLVYPEFNRMVHVIEGDIKMLPIKELIGGIDFGFTNPAVALLVGIDGDDNLYVIKEIYQKRLLTEDFSMVIKGWEKQLDLYSLPTFYADPSEPAVITHMNKLGLKVVAARNEVMKGIIEVSNKLKIKGDGKPSLFVHETCQNMINEFMMYRYPDEVEDKEVKDKPLKVNDHAMDALRYAVFTRFRKSGGVGLKLA